MLATTASSSAILGAPRQRTSHPLVDTEDHDAAVEHVGKGTQRLCYLGDAACGTLDLYGGVLAAPRSHLVESSR